jgi:hypothetical protein
MNLVPVLGALLMLRPALQPVKALQNAWAITSVSGDSDEAAALVVVAMRESGGGLGCVEGIGGRGTFGLGVGYADYDCGPLELQALAALQALRDKGWPNQQKAFTGYLGGHRFEKNTEAQTRYMLWVKTKERIDCACCI